MKKKLLLIIVSFLLAQFCFAVTISNVQTDDPIIGKDITITALVTGQVKECKLMLRRYGIGEFQSIDMAQCNDANDNYYCATIEGQDVSEDFIEWYIVAKDNNGMNIFYGNPEKANIFIPRPPKNDGDKVMKLVIERETFLYRCEPFSSEYNLSVGFKTSSNTYIESDIHIIEENDSFFSFEIKGDSDPDDGFQNGPFEGQEIIVRIKIKLRPNYYQDMRFNTGEEIYYNTGDSIVVSDIISFNEIGEPRYTYNSIALENENKIDLSVGNYFLNATQKETHTFKVENVGCDDLVIIDAIFTDSINFETEDFKSKPVTIPPQGTYSFAISYNALEDAENDLFIYHNNSKIWQFGVNLKGTIPLEADLVIEDTICDSFTFNNKMYDQSGTYYDTLKAFDGSDSTVAMRLTKAESFSVDIHHTMNYGDVFNFGTLSLTESGVYKDIYTTEMGCDSVFVIHLTELPDQPKVIEKEIVSCGEYSYKNQVYTASGTYYDSLKAASGADSTIILYLTVNPVKPIEKDSTISLEYGTAYVFGDKTLVKAGSYTHTFIASTGCDSTVNLTLTYVPKKVDACESYDFNGKILTESGIYCDTLIASDMSDSIAEIDLTVNEKNIIPINLVMTEGETFKFLGEEFTLPGVYEVEVRNCTAFELNLVSVKPEVVVRQDSYIVCGEYDFYGRKITESGYYIDTLDGPDGADTIHFLTLYVNPVYDIKIAKTVNYGEIYQFGTQELTKSGIYTETFKSLGRCDSTVTMDFTVLDPETVKTELTETACGEYDYNGDVLTESKEYTYTFKAENGADSIVILDLTVYPEYETADSKTVEFGESFQFGTQELSESGTYTEVFESTHGCDSTVTMDFTVLDPEAVKTELTETACGSFEYNGDVLTESKEYTYTFKAVSGADSIVVLDLIVYPEFETADIKTVAFGETYQFGTQELTKSGTYTETFKTVNGCDSTVTLDFTVLDPETVKTELTEIACGEYDYNGDVLTESKEYSYTFKAENGADSIVVLDLTVYPKYKTTDSKTVEFGESFQFGTQELSESGTYTEVFESTLGCDSTVTLDFTVLDPETIKTELTETACGSFEYNGDVLTESKEYTYTFNAESGADSIVVLDLTVYPEYETADSKTVEFGETFQFGTQELSESGTYTEVFESTHGCDSTVTLDFTVLDPETIKTELTETACGSLEYNGDVLTESKEYTYTFKAVSGADSIVVLDLMVYPEYERTDSKTVEFGETFQFGTQELSESGTYTEVFESTHGCDSTVTMDFTVLDPETVKTELTETVCGEYDYNGDVLTESKEYSYTFKAANGADSVVILDLTVYPEFETADSKTVEFGESFQFGTQELSESGTYTEVFESAHGCDSTVTLDFTVLEKVNEKPEIRMAVTEFDVYENAPEGTLVATVAATDDNSSVLDFSLADGSAFAIDAETGEITVNNPELLDYEAVQEIQLTVTVSDGELEDSVVLTVTLKDVPETAIAGMDAVLKIFPVPVNKILSVRAEGVNGKLTILTESGVSMIETDFSSKKELDLSRLTPGAYLILLQTEKAVYENWFVKQ